ncbi:ATP-binding protein [Streptomyces sp. NPDC051940]|uniref:ATP-binding protein n=1 Tax=Streptomyces sp. NPDC051940 TaxID=3155675 RepID=UPI0034478A6C
MTSLITDPLLWILLGVVVLACLAVMRARTTNIALRTRIDHLTDGARQQHADQERLFAENAGLRGLRDEELAQVRGDAAEGTKNVLRSAMRTLQSLAQQQQVVISRLQKKYGEDSEILSDLMQVDHTNSQFSRRAQGIAVLCGGWLGRHESAVTVFDVARSAQGRIRQFDRVRINSDQNVWVVSRAVEPVAVALAELLANATNSSAHDKPVEVGIQSAPAGVCLIVDDFGVGMSQEEKDRAKALLSPSGPIEITSLGDPPKFGFAVAGQLAHRFGFSISVDSMSPYGGVRAVILLPRDLLTTEAPEPVAEAVVEEPHAAPQKINGPLSKGPVGTTRGGLPKRRRISVAVAPEADDTADDGTDESPRTAETTAAQLGAFRRGSLLGRELTIMEGSQDQ